MSDLRWYRDTKQPLAERMHRAANDNLESGELDTLLHQFAQEITGWARTAREEAVDGDSALDNGTYDSADLESAANTLKDIANALASADDIASAGT